MRVLWVLHRDHVVAPVAELFGDNCADHLIEQQPHPAPCRRAATVASPEQCLLGLVAASQLLGLCASTPDRASISSRYSA